MKTRRDNIHLLEPPVVGEKYMGNPADILDYLEQDMEDMPELFEICILVSTDDGNTVQIYGNTSDAKRLWLLEMAKKAVLSD